MATQLNDIDLTIRRIVYDRALAGHPIPLRAELASRAKVSEAEAAGSLDRLSDAHMLVLQRDGKEILMANPFSAVPTPFVAKIAGRKWFGNCIWDAMGVFAMVGAGGIIEASCGCCGTAMDVKVPYSATSDDTRRVHFAIPAAHWWDDIVFN